MLILYRGNGQLGNALKDHLNLVEREVIIHHRWDYRDKSEEIKVALRVRIEKAEQRTAREVQLREQEARVNALLRARIAEFEAAQERRGEHSAKRPAEPGDGHPDEAKRGREADERPPSPKLG